MPNIKLVRRNKATGTIEGRKKGRPHPDFEYGYLDESNVFHLDTPKQNVQIVRSGDVASPLPEIERIVNQEVKRRILAAKEKAVKVFSDSLGV